MIGWVRGLVDRWRRGPDLRAMEKSRDEWFEKARDRGLELEREQVEHSHVRRHLAAAQERNRLLSAFIHGDVQARCRAGCGNKSFDFELRLVDAPTGGQVLIPVCGECRRRVDRERRRLAELAQEGKDAVPETLAAPQAALPPAADGC